MDIPSFWLGLAAGTLSGLVAMVLLLLALRLTRRDPPAIDGAWRELPTTALRKR